MCGKAQRVGCVSTIDHKSLSTGNVGPKVWEKTFFLCRPQEQIYNDYIFIGRAEGKGQFIQEAS